MSRPITNRAALREAIGKKLGWWHGSTVHAQYEKDLDEIMNFIPADQSTQQERDTWYFIAIVSMFTIIGVVGLAVLITLTNR